MFRYQTSTLRWKWLLKNGLDVDFTHIRKNLTILSKGKTSRFGSSHIMVVGVVVRIKKSWNFPSWKCNLVPIPNKIGGNRTELLQRFKKIANKILKAVEN